MNIFKWLVSRKYRYHYGMFKGVENMIWNNEFKRFKLITDREAVRREYDNARSKLYILETQLKSFPEDKAKWTDEQKRVEDKKTLIVLNIEGEKNGDGSVAKQGYKDQMRDFDLEINGSGKTNEFPKGLQGVNQQIDGLRELQALTKAYLKTL